MTENPQDLNQEHIKNKILNAARDIISKEGVQGLSIRKITKTIGYSPGIVYHYFTDKNEIVESIMSEGFGKIMASIKSVQKNEKEPEKEIKEVFTNYIKTTLKYPEEYKAFVLNDDPAITKRISVLDKGTTEKRPTLMALRENIQRGIDLGRYAPRDPELTAQIVWTSISGLLIRLILEKNIPEEQVNRLIEHQFEMLFNGLLAYN